MPGDEQHDSGDDEAERDRPDRDGDVEPARLAEPPFNGEPHARLQRPKGEGRRRAPHTEPDQPFGLPITPFTSQFMP